MTGYFYARRKRDDAQTIVWLYEDAAEVQRVSCVRSQAADPKDFDILGPVPPFAQDKWPLEGQDG